MLQHRRQLHHDLPRLVLTELRPVLLLQVIDQFRPAQPIHDQHPHRRSLSQLREALVHARHAVVTQQLQHVLLHGKLRYRQALAVRLLFQPRQHRRSRAPVFPRHDVERASVRVERRLGFHLVRVHERHRKQRLHHRERPIARLHAPRALQRSLRASHVARPRARRASSNSRRIRVEFASLNSKGRDARARPAIDRRARRPRRPRRCASTASTASRRADARATVRRGERAGECATFRETHDWRSRAPRDETRDEARDAATRERSTSRTNKQTH